MGQALVTKLHEAATDTRIGKVGELHIHITPTTSSNPYAHRVLFAGRSGTSIECYIRGAGHFTNANLTADLGDDLEGTFSTDIDSLADCNVLYLSDGEYDLYITNKYALTWLVLGSTDADNLNGLDNKHFDISQLKGCYNLKYVSYVGIDAYGTVNKIIYDDLGIPSQFVEIPPIMLDELIDGAPNVIHPAFMVGGRQRTLYIGKYKASVANNRLQSQYGKDPLTFITTENFTNMARAKGNGFHIITGVEHGLIAHYTKRFGISPNGNNNFGVDWEDDRITAIPSSSKTPEGLTRRTFTGTGMLDWSSNGHIDGIFDLNGNAWESLNGLRIFNQELQVIPYNNAAMNDADLSNASTEWRAIKSDATSWRDLYVIPDGQGTTSKTIKINYVNNRIAWGSKVIDIDKNTHIAARVRNRIVFDTDVSDISKQYIKSLGLAPDEDDTQEPNYKEDTISATINGIQYAASSGGWGTREGAGNFCVAFSSPNNYSGESTGTRVCYYE